MPSSVPLDLVDAVLQQLRGSDCAALFGDTWDASAHTGVEKFGSDYVPDVDPPWLVITEPNEAYTYMSPGQGSAVPFLADGQLQVSIFARDRRQARELGYAVAAALNDAVLVYVDRHHGSLRVTSAGFVPIPQTGPGVPAMFHRVLILTYQNQGVL